MESNILQVEKKHSKPLVSIITPCYNGEHCLFRLLDSIIAQTYRPIEFILVNDGSKDGTKTLAESYKSLFDEAGINYIIVNQENKGLGGAINAGLKRFTGDYLCWPDADDYLEPTSIEERVRVLEEHLDYAVVSSDAYIRDISKLDTYETLLSSSRKYLSDPNQFIHHLNGDSIFCSGCHMARTSMFLEAHPDREIYPARRGQNWQLLLPLYYRYKWIFLNKPLYNYISYPNSMSHNDDSLESLLFRYEEHEAILNATLKKIENIQHTDMKPYFTLVKNKYAKLRMTATIKYQNQELFQLEFKKKKSTIGIDLGDIVLYWRQKRPLFNKVLILCSRFAREGTQLFQMFHLKK